MKQQDLNKRLAEHQDKHGFALIAEIGQNHQGSLDIAEELVEAACRYPEVFAIKTAVRVLDSGDTTPRYGRHSFGPTEARHRAFLELQDWHVGKLGAMCRCKKKLWGLSFTNKKGMEKAASHLPDFFKVPAYLGHDSNITNAAKKECAVIASKMPTHYLDQSIPSMLCTVAYPSPVAATKINHIKGSGLGLSSHCPSWIPDLVAYGVGARLFERHITFDRNMRGTDHQASLDLRQLDRYIADMREAALCVSCKDSVHDCELPYLAKLRREDYETADDGWIGYDLDGTIATYDGQSSGERIGLPIWPTFGRMIEDIANGREVRIVTARVAVDDERERARRERVIRDWLQRYLPRGSHETIAIVSGKDERMKLLIDDRTERP